MAVTIKKIAEYSGVSRGTVDRVLNNRGNVKPETEALVRKIADQLGYTPNIAGKALAARKKSLTIGIILISEGNTFFDDVINGIRQAEKELKDYGVNIVLKRMKGYNVQEQLNLIEELKENINILILNAISDTAIADAIAELSKKNIGVITVNTDIENSKRLCYVGSDYEKGGETACGMIGFLTNGCANIGILTGSEKILGHRQRVAGFRKIMKNKYPNMKEIAFAATDDDDIQAYEVTKQMLFKHKEIDALFIVAAGIYGVCRAVMHLGLERKINIISFEDRKSVV